MPIVCNLDPTEGSARPETRVGIFVGGRSRRMAGRPKGLLVTASGQTVLEYLVATVERIGMTPVLVGQADPYQHLVGHVPRIADDRDVSGPLGGLRALLRSARADRVIALACDMPHVSPEALRYLGAYRSRNAVVAARDSVTGRWEPFFARYQVQPGRVALEHAVQRGVRSFQAFYREIEPHDLPMPPALARTLDDWDTPADLV